jgi:hypothetical protein
MWMAKTMAAKVAAFPMTAAVAICASFLGSGGGPPPMPPIRIIFDEMKGIEGNRRKDEDNGGDKSESDGEKKMQVEQD